MTSFTTMPAMCWVGWVRPEAGKLRARRRSASSGRKSAVNGAIREMEKRLVKR